LLKPSEYPDWANDSSALKRNPDISMSENGWKTSDGTTEGVAQKPTLEHTNGWFNKVGLWIRELSQNGGDPVGTYLETTLTETQFNTLQAGIWMPCDGRSCAGTLYAQRTGRNTVPDLRYKYLYMSGQNTTTTIPDMGAVATESDQYMYTDNMVLTVDTGSLDIQVGGDSVSYDGDFITGTSDTHSQYVNVPLSSYESKLFFSGSALFLETKDEFKRISPDMDSGELANGLSYGQATNASDIKIQVQSHTHTYTANATGNLNFEVEKTLSNPNPYLKAVNINYAEETVLQSHQCNIFIRVN